MSNTKKSVEVELTKEGISGIDTKIEQPVSVELDLTNVVEYQSHKRVHALPMTLGEYNKYRGWDLPADENGEELGYFVIYDKGTMDHYESWSPKAQFERGNSTVEEVEHKAKSLGNTDVNGAAKNVEDLVIFGNGDLFKLVSKASSEAEGWMKSTKACNMPTGVLVQVTTQQGDHVAEALQFIPGVRFDADMRTFKRM